MCVCVCVWCPIENGLGWLIVLGHWLTFFSFSQARDQRFFFLFVSCCQPELVAGYLLDLLDRQLLQISPLVLRGFEALPGYG